MKKFLLILSVAVTVCSCGSYKRLAYLQDMSSTSTYDVTQRPNPRIAIGDELNITVSSTIPQLVAPFNVQSATTTYDVISQIESYEAGKRSSSYPVDKDGNIDFPVLGKIFVEGMTPDDLSDLIENEIKGRNYVKDPKVEVKFSNFTVTVLGEFNMKSELTVPSGGINIFEVLAQSGDLTDDALRDNVWVIRTTGDTRKVYTLNLKSRSVFDSPAFWLQQNDIVYAAPKDSKMDTSSWNVNSLITTCISIISTIGTILLWMTVYTR